MHESSIAENILSVAEEKVREVNSPRLRFDNLMKPLPALNSDAP